MKSGTQNSGKKSKKRKSRLALEDNGKEIKIAEGVGSFMKLKSFFSMIFF